MQSSKLMKRISKTSAIQDVAEDEREQDIDDTDRKEHNDEEQWQQDGDEEESKDGDDYEVDKQEDLEEVDDDDEDDELKLDQNEDGEARSSPSIVGVEGSPDARTGDLGMQEVVKGFGAVTNDISHDTTNYQLNTGQSFGDIVSDPSQSKITQEQRQKLIDQSWNPMNGKFNVPEGSQLQRAMEELKYQEQDVNENTFNPSGAVQFTISGVN